MNDIEFAKAQIAPQRWAIEGLLPEGLTVVAAPGKTGKSFMIFGIAGDVAWGEKVFDTFPTDNGDVLYMANEGHPSSWQMRMLTMLAGRERDPNGKLHFERNWPSAAQGGLQMLENWLKDFPTARVIVIDVLRNFLPIRGWSQNEDAASIKMLSDLALKYHVAIVAVHHTNRRGSRKADKLEHIQGTMGVSAAADCIWILERERNQPNAVLTITGKDVEEMQLALVFDPEHACFTLGTDTEIADNGKVMALSPERQTILDWIESHPGQTAPEIASALGSSYENQRQLLWKMKSQRQVFNVAGRYYTQAAFDAIKAPDPQLSMEITPASGVDFLQPPEVAYAPANKRSR